MKNITLLILISFYNLLAQVNGTSGLPIGGIGTGAIKYNASDGTFSASFKSPTRNGDYQLCQDTQFQLFTKRSETIITSDKLKVELKNGLPDDDAIFPLHHVNFGNINGTSVEMTAYIPYSPDSVSMMLHPCAMYEFTFNNTKNDTVLMSIAFQVKTNTIPEAIPDSGIISDSSGMQLCLLGVFDDSTGKLSYGSDNNFFSSGICNNQLTQTTNRLALNISLNSLETKQVRFILSWYRKDDEAHYRYTALWNNAKDVAASALNNFDEFKNNDNELVDRMRASNLPSWLVDQTLNSLVNLVNNSVYFQDGRYCHTEGQWSPEGTMDQMWHARQIYTMINPELAWQELEWWARTQHVQNFTGQIHHDFGTNFNYVSWDNTEHADYRSIDKWVDLNCGFIISVYEAFIATADHDKLTYFWPYLKKAGHRILDQVQLYGSSEYPYTFSGSYSTYDAGGNSQAYNAGLSAVVYNIMKNLSVIMGEPDTDSLYSNARQKVIEGFKDRYLINPYQVGYYCESALSGPWISNFLKMGPFWKKEDLDVLYNSISDYYNPLNNGMGYSGGSYLEWQPYLISHLGGYALQTNRINIWLSLQKDMYNRNYLNRNLVFNQQLGIPPKVNSVVKAATSASGANQYISIPVLWRNYYDIIGFHQNKYSGELWLEPRLINSEEHQMQNALVIMPGGYASLSYNTYSEFYQDQKIFFIPDKPVNVSSLYVWDLYADSGNAINFVKVNGTETNFSRIREGEQSHIKINWTGIISNSGITIEIEGNPREGNPVSIKTVSNQVPGNYYLSQNYPNPFNPNTSISYDIPVRSLVTLSIYNILGQKIIDLVNDFMNPGRYKVTWNAANLSSGLYLYRIRAGKFISTKKLMLLK